MPKIPIYFVPGLAANHKIFEYVNLPEDKFEIHYLKWILPQKEDEPIYEYAKRMCEGIKHKNPVLIGVSFGGLMVQEMSKIVICKRIIIISSIKSNQELPKRLRLAQVTKAYKLFPTSIVANIEKFEKYFLGDYLKKRATLYKTYLSVRKPEYLHWAIYNVLHWQQEKPLENITHIHGNKDEIFPLKHINNVIEVKQGTHIMILNKAKTISKLIQKELA